MEILTTEVLQGQGRFGHFR